METLNMRSRLNRATALIACATMGAIFYFAAIRTTGQASRTPRTPDGHPNLNGIWQATTTANWDLLGHAMRTAVPQPGLYPDVPVLAAPVLALGSVGGVPPGPGGVEGKPIPTKPEAAGEQKEK